MEEQDKGYDYRKDYTNYNHDTRNTPCSKSHAMKDVSNVRSRSGGKDPQDTGHKEESYHKQDDFNEKCF